MRCFSYLFISLYLWLSFACISSAINEDQISFERGLYARSEGNFINIYDLYDNTLEYSFAVKDTVRKIIFITHPFEQMANGILVQYTTGDLELFSGAGEDGRVISLSLEMSVNTIHSAFIEANTLLIEMKNPWHQSAPYLVFNLSTSMLKSVDPGCPLTNIHLYEGGNFFSGISVSSSPRAFLYHISDKGIEKNIFPDSMIYNRHRSMPVEIKDIYLDHDLLYVIYTEHNGETIKINIHEIVSKKIIENISINGLLASAKKIKFSLDGSRIEAWKSDNWAYNYNLLEKRLETNKSYQGSKIVYQKPGSYIVRFETADGIPNFFFRAQE